MPNANLDISVGVQYKKMQVNEPYTPTLVGTESFHYTSDLNTYTTLTPTIASEVYAFIASIRADGYETNVNFDVRLENVTHVPVGRGVVPLSKGHRNTGLTGEETTSATVIQNSLNDVVADLKTLARY